MANTTPDGTPAPAAPAAPISTPAPDATSHGAPATPAPDAGATPGAAAVTTPAPEVKPGDPASAAPAAPAAPASYDLVVPDDAKGLIDDRVVERLKTLGKQAGWSQADAQAAIDEHIGMVKAQAATFLAETTSDPTYGGEHLAESQRLALAVINRIRPAGHARAESFQKFLATGGAGNHIEVVSFLADLGRLMGEDRPPTGRGSAGPAKESAEIIFDHPSSIAAQEAAKRRG